eukprot:1943856-Amphidinium_carterae.1
MLIILSPSFGTSPVETIMQPSVADFGWVHALYLCAGPFPKKPQNGNIGFFQQRFSAATL